MLSDNYYRKALVTRVIDGDTFDALVDLGFYVSIKQRFRILGIDAPEIKGVSRPLGLKSKEFLCNLIENKEVLIHSTMLDGFRRSLANVYVYQEDGTTQSVATLMLDANMAEVRTH